MCIRDRVWKTLMLGPHDYGPEAIAHPDTRSLMSKMDFQHGGAEYDRRYPEGIPTSLKVEMASGAAFDSGLVMFPAGHARNTTADLRGILDAKFALLGKLAMDKPKGTIRDLLAVGEMGRKDLARVHDFKIEDRGAFE